MLTLKQGVILTFYCLLVIYSGNNHAVELTMVTDHGPPHTIESTHSGIDVDITKAVLRKMGYSTNILFMPLGRGKQQVMNKKADLFLPTFFEKDGDGLYISNAIIDYRPTFFTRNDDPFTIENIADLAGKKIVTFQGASQYFGENFLKMTQENTNYREVSSMSLLPLLLMKERYDVVLLDYYIFYYFFKTHQLSDVKEHVIFDSVDAHVGFNDVSLRNEFNRVLSSFKYSEEYLNIIRKYLPHY